MYRNRVRENQDLVIIVSDSSNRRGTGKSILSLKLANAMDRTEEGLTKDKVAIDPAKIQKQYVEAPKGSALILDEAEAGLSKFRAGSTLNMMMRQLVSMGRVQEKYLILNLPASSELDRDLKALCDFWMLVNQKGTAQGHLLDFNPYREKALTPKTETWEWTDIPETHELRDVYDYLTEKKMAHLHGESDSSNQYVSRSEHSSAIEKARSETERETKVNLLNQVYRNCDVTQKELADSIGISRSYLADLVSE
jgi:hypothetical protein